MVVWNTFQNDARVLKEAETLAGQGHRVTVFALMQPGETPAHEVLARGLEVVRVRRAPALGRLFRPDGSRPPRGVERSVAGGVTGAFVDRDERDPAQGTGRPSDHAPVVVDLD